LKSAEADSILQRLFVNGVRDSALQQYLRVHARKENFSDTVEKARIYVEANELSAVATRKPAVRFAYSPDRSNDNSETYADKIMDGLHKVLRAAEQNSGAKVPHLRTLQKHPQVRRVRAIG